MTSWTWPAMLPVRYVRIARPTDQLDVVVRFYREGLGLPELDRFAGHAGYRGVLLGLPGTQYHLEFTQHERGSPGSAGSAARWSAATPSCRSSAGSPAGWTGPPGGISAGCSWPPV